MVRPVKYPPPAPWPATLALAVFGLVVLAVVAIVAGAAGLAVLSAPLVALAGLVAIFSGGTSRAGGPRPPEAR